MDKEKLYEFLMNRGLIYPHNVVNILSYKIFSDGRKAFLLRGPPGSGKTSLAHAVADFLDAEFVFYQCTTGTSEDDLIYKYIPSEKSKSGISIALSVLPLSLIKSKKKLVVLLIDEFDKTRPSADSLLLDFLQNYRLAVYLGGRRNVIHGDMKNLIVFLTSNDERELSEPLLRRLIVLNLEPLPTINVYRILSRRFPNNIATLLTQIYEDTLKAGLRKPATIQELFEAGEMLIADPSIGINEIIKHFIIKYDDDLDSFLDYIKKRKPYQFIGGNRGDIDVSNYYDPGDMEICIDSRDNEYKEDCGRNAGEILNKLEGLIVRRTDNLGVKPVKASKNEVVTVKIRNEDDIGYTKVIKIFIPEPTDDPRKFGKFIVKEDDGSFIVSKEPLSLNEVKKLSEVDGEYYFEGEFKAPYSKFVEALIESSDRIRYYTRDRILVEGGEDSIILLDVRIKRLDKVTAMIKLKGYLKVSGKLPRLYKEVIDVDWENASSGKIKDIFINRILRLRP